MIGMIGMRRTETVRTNLQRETVRNSKRFLVASLLGMTATPAVIPSVSEESAFGNVAGDGGRLAEIPRRSAPRDDRGGRFGMTATPVVIPSVSEESAFGNVAGDGGRLAEIPRRSAPRDDRGQGGTLRDDRGQGGTLRDSFLKLALPGHPQPFDMDAGSVIPDLTITSPYPRFGFFRHSCESRACPGLDPGNPCLSERAGGRISGRG
jgi:hypothetical protein